MWRAANGINPKDPRPTGGTQLETLPALWKQRLDRDIARATYPPADARGDKRQTAGAAPGSYDHSERPYQNPDSVRTGRPPQADSTPQSSDCGARNMRMHATRRRQDTQDTHYTAEIWLFHIKGLATLGQAARVLATLRAAPPAVSPDLSGLKSSRDVQLERAQHLLHELLNRAHETICVRHGIAALAVRQLPPVADPAGHSVGKA